ncbi:MAG TPA: glycosyltransferase [Candidatus Acidoferrum sp.]|nr:glycosyltransferase [Candidatus Acidoferrum sp.]
MIKVMHIITTLGPAGAENMLCRIASGMDGARFENEIISLTDILDLAERMQGIGVRVRTLGMKSNVPNPLLVLRLAQWIRETKPDVIHTWMYHANLVGSLAARLAGDVPVIWGIHHSALDPSVDKRRTMSVNRLCALLSRKFSARIVCCSEASQRIHKTLGYAAEKLEVIPNGFDLEKVKPDPAARQSIREELGLPSDAILIGIAARFHPHKDHRNFIYAAERLHKRMPEIHFVLCGMEITPQNSLLVEWIEAAGIRDCCHLLGHRTDISRLLAGLDIATTSSRSEAFPMAIGEAMACETPCVVTDVGDSALIVGETGTVVKPGDSHALAEAWRKLAEAGPAVRRRLGIAARRRVQQQFALPAIVERYQAIYARLATQGLTGVHSSSLSECAR